MFGNGDVIISHATKASPIGFALLCEVALGKMLKKREAEMIQKLPDKYQSCMGEGKLAPDPSSFVKMYSLLCLALTSFSRKSGCVIPCGEPVETGIKDTSLQYNEFIVYDTSQVICRYLVQLVFFLSILITLFFTEIQF